MEDVLFSDLPDANAGIRKLEKQQECPKKQDMAQNPRMA